MQCLKFISPASSKKRGVYLHIVSKIYKTRKVPPLLKKKGIYVILYIIPFISPTSLKKRSNLVFAVLKDVDYVSVMVRLNAVLNEIALRF